MIPLRETILVLEGRPRRRRRPATHLDLGAGDIASLPKGARIGWDSIA